MKASTPNRLHLEASPRISPYVPGALPRGTSPSTWDRTGCATRSTRSTGPGARAAQGMRRRWRVRRRRRQRPRRPPSPLPRRRPSSRASQRTSASARPSTLRATGTRSTRTCSGLWLDGHPRRGRLLAFLAPCSCATYAAWRAAMSSKLIDRLRPLVLQIPRVLLFRAAMPWRSVGAQASRYSISLVDPSPWRTACCS